ncbi:hypothetical protein GOP47_0029607, partial [Adiantum capillus-veneris]
INISGISVGAEPLDLPQGIFALQEDGSGGVVVDSGTSFTMLPGAVYQQLKKAMKRSIPAINDAIASSFDELTAVCYDSSTFTELENIPPLTFHLAGGNLVVPGKNFFVDIDGGLKCLAIEPIAKDGDASILGNLQQRDFLVTYDNNAATLTFTGPISCL